MNILFPVLALASLGASKSKSKSRSRSRGGKGAIPGLAPSPCLSRQSTPVKPVLLDYFWVGLGGALGSISRVWAAGCLTRHFGESFPWGTLAVNVTGSFLIGFFAACTGPDGRWPVSSSVRTFFMAGVCGGYTTFSSFSLQTLNLMQDGRWGHATAYTLSSVVLCLIAVWLGHAVALAFNPARGN